MHNRMIDLDMENTDAPFTFRAVQVFVAVVEAGSVTRGAHQLGISPSTVSQQLAGLETSLGTKLIERNARQFRLTKSGTLFLEPARKLLDDVGAAKAKLVVAEEAPPMALSVALIEELDASVTARWLVRLQQIFPNIALSVTSGASHENHDALSTRAVDMMIAVDTVGQADWVEQHALLRDPFLLVTARRGEDAPNLDALQSRPFVRYASNLQIGRQVEAQLRRTETQPARGYEFSTNQALFAMTAELDGWAITTALAYLGTPYAEDRLHPHPMPLPQFSRRIALHARAGTLSALPAHMAEELRDCLQARIVDRAATSLPFVGDGLCVLS